MTISIRNQLLLGLLVLLVCMPRFDRNDALISGVTGGETLLDNDSAHYVSMVDIFRGDEPLLQPDAPFTYRPLVPYIASFIPLPSLTAINVLNVISLWAAALLLGRLLMMQGMGIVGTNVLLIAFAFSFPVFYYGAIGYIDPVIIGMLSAGCYAIEKRQDWLLVLLVFMGVFVKEAIVLLLPVFLVSGWMQRRGLLPLVGWLLLMVVAYMVAGRLARSMSLDPIEYNWSFSLSRFNSNTERVRTWLSFLLTLGIPGFLSLLAVFVTLYQKQWDVLLRMAPWLVGCAGSVALFAYSLLVAYSDGRFIWPATVFAIPLLGIFVTGNNAWLIGILDRIRDRK